MATLLETRDLKKHYRNVHSEYQGGPTGNLFSLPLWLVAGAIGFAFLVSLVAGSYPASRAARLDPIQALRHDSTSSR